MLWIEPDLGTVSGGLRYNQQVRAALNRMGVKTSVIALPPQDGAAALDVEGVRSARLAHGVDTAGSGLVVVDGLLGSAHPELFDGASPAADVLLVHLPAAAAQEAEGLGDPEVVSRERWAVLNAPHVVAVSSWGADELRRRYRRQDVHVAVPGVHRDSGLPDSGQRDSGLPDPGQRASTDRPSSHRDSPASSYAPGPGSVVRLTTVAALNPLKNHRLLIDALEPLLDYEWTWVLAGPGAETPWGVQVLKEARERLPGRVEYRGVLNPGEVTALWGQTDLLLLPSLVETYGMVVTEACAQGVPAVVSEGTGAQEAAADAGLVADPRSPAEWSETLRRYFEDPELRNSLAEKAARRRQTLPEWEETAQVFLGLGE
ncbi:glycosyltransferase family 4 protein [Nesterenkonia flava]|uniref:Glycosyltransferase family 4 protein n=2 Tax=Nesterenkonia flava TaxID=469799 RepID=A0ABU1FR22_9MICC|nr:glycosyltransferase family 4 protein [Nesterenkonia flava]MDR5711099.1 glycosyltransferase family 4 protein [Nesterenkonia flava]